MDGIAKYRLHSNAFERQEEDNSIESKRLVFLSVEGVSTEPDYFKSLNKHLRHRSETIFHVEVLRRKRSDGSSEPLKVLELMDEYMDVRDNGILPRVRMEQLEQKYSKETISLLLTHPDTIPKSTLRDIGNDLLMEGINLHYRKYLKDISRENNDIFAVIIDRDGGIGGRSRDVIESCMKECIEKDYLLFISNPCFEFWLLLHLCDVKTEYAHKMIDIKENKRISKQHSFVSNEVSNRAAHGKSINNRVFAEKYYPNITQAIERAKDFATAQALLLDHVGTNIHELFQRFGF